MSGAQPKFPLTISLNVLEHLGINLYSNVPAVLSETVANAWDADASEVRVDWKTDGTIVIQDDGIGMTPADIVNRFLTVGYQRRDKQPGMTEKKNRRPMGRKGIGKLSLFSVANIVDVETTKDGIRTAFRLDVDKIREKIRSEGGSGTYYAEPLPDDDIDFLYGTRLTLRGLRRRRISSTTIGLKRRIARRFSVIGEKHGFLVFIDGHQITPSDRDYYDKIRYIWTYGDQRDVLEQCTAREHHEPRKGDQDNLTVTGWLATVKRARDLKDSEVTRNRQGDNLNRIAIFVRGKLAQEDMLTDFAEKGVYASYLIGELYVDDFDRYDGPGTSSDPDAATSSRQRIVEDDKRYQQLWEIILEELKHIQRQWKKLRSDEGLKRARSIPEVNDWLEQLHPPYRTKAQSWLGRLNRIQVRDSKEQKNLIKHAVLAFVFYMYNEDLERLKSVSDMDLRATLDVFRSLDDLENNLYGQITRQRVDVIRTLQEKVDSNLYEPVIQKYLFDHPWLLDPSWERAEGTEVMERRVGNLFEKIEAKLTKKEELARLDIAYRKTAGQHVIIELKRPEKRVRTTNMLPQIEKYTTGMTKLLKKLSEREEPVEFVVVLGKEPIDWSDDGGKKRSIGYLRQLNARIVFYDKLLEDAFRAYSDYMKKHRTITQLSKLIQAIEDYAPSEQ